MAGGLTALAIVWAVLIVAAPVALRSAATALPASVLYVAASRICHQRPERSFIIADYQMPVCARCSGLYLSAAVGTLLAWRSRRSIAHVPRAVLLVAALPTAITFGLEIAGVMPFSNVVRAIAALPLGAVAGWLFVRMLTDGH
jgi:uncharacterized membrane protein